MKIKERPEYKSKPEATRFLKTQKVREAVRSMSEKNYGCSVIVDEQDHVVGIVSERDLMRRVLNENVDIDKTDLADIMTKDVRVAREDDDVVDWLRIMSNERFRHLPVVDENNVVKCLMSQGDFVSYTWPDLLDKVKEKAKQSVTGGYPVFLIIVAVLIYTLIMTLVN